MTEKFAKGDHGRPPMSAAGAEALPRLLRRMMERARQQVAATINVRMTLLYWRFIKRLGSEVLGGQRPAYGRRRGRVTLATRCSMPLPEPTY
ncbi:MAG: hypothetical protein AB1486_31445 [Planctomycetota bacterium]